MIGVYAATLIIYVGCYLIIASLEFVFAEAENLNRDVKYRKKIKFGLRWLFWRLNKTEEIFLIIFIHQLLTILFTTLSTILFNISIIKQNADLNLGLAIFVFVYLVYIVAFHKITKFKIKKDINKP